MLSRRRRKTSSKLGNYGVMDGDTGGRINRPRHPQEQAQIRRYSTRSSQPQAVLRIESALRTKACSTASKPTNDGVVRAPLTALRCATWSVRRRATTARAGTGDKFQLRSGRWFCLCRRETSSLDEDTVAIGREEPKCIAKYHPCDIDNMDKTSTYWC